MKTTHYLFLFFYKEPIKILKTITKIQPDSI